MKRVALPVLELLALVALGVMAGFFFAFAVDVAPAMRHLDAAAYITTQQWINSTVRSVPFGLAYFGAAFLPFIVVAAAWLSGERRSAVAWAMIAVAYFGAVFWVTRAVNIPINDELGAWNPAAPPAGWADVRDHWNEWNALRAVVSLGCFVVAAAWMRLRSAVPAR